MKFTSRYLVLSLMFLSLKTFAQQDITLEDDLRPVWEAGAFLGVFNNPEYPASNQSNTNVVPVPYFIYRGETLRVGDGSIARAVA